VTAGGGTNVSVAADRTLPALVVTVVALAAFNASRSLLPSGLDLAANIAMAGVVLMIAAWASESATELGLARKDLGRGVAYGAAAFALVAAVLVIAAFIPAAKGYFDDDRADVGAGSMLFEVLIEVPLGTVLLEELAFRGSLLALLRRRLPVRPAVLVCSLLFGCWHIGVAISSASGNAAVPDSGGGLVLTVLGTVAATTVAGIVFCWLRLRSGSLVAPMLAHIATNSVAFTVAWTLAR
jgi:membrane protease YdiL (CAAX protease family)